MPITVSEPDPTFVITNEGGSVFFAPIAVETPEIGAVGSVRIFNGFYEQAFVLGAAPAGWTWKIGLVSGPHNPADGSAGVVTVQLAAIGASREPAMAWVVRDADGEMSSATPILLEWPTGAAPDAPMFVAPIDSVQANVGDAAVSIDCAAAFSGDGLEFTATLVSGADLPPGWSVDFTTGEFTADTDEPIDAHVIVTANNAAGQAWAIFRVLVAVVAPRFTSQITAITASVGALVEIDFKDYVIGTGLTFEVDQPGWSLVDGVLTIPTDAPLETLSVTVTATDVIGQQATDQFPVTVSAVAPPPGPVITGTIAPVVARVGDPARLVNVGALTQPKTGLTWTNNRGWTISTAGVLTIPTGSVIAVGNVTVTATDAFTNAASITFSVRVDAVVAVALAIPTRPTFAANSTPVVAGTVLTGAGHVIAGGITPYFQAWEVKRDGGVVKALANGNGPGYTVGAADIPPTGQTRTMTQRLRVTDSTPTTPQVVTVDSIGSVVISPTPPVGPADFVVNNAAQLLTAMTSAAAMAGPRTILCNPGDYGPINRTGLVKVGAGAGGINDANRVTILAANRNQGALARCRFFNSYWEWHNCDGFTIDGFVFESTAKDPQGYPAADAEALKLYASKNITFRNCTFKGTHRNLATQPVMVNFKIEWCEFTAIGMDNVSVFGARNRIIKFHNNYHHDMDVDGQRASSDTPNRHPDACSTQGRENVDVEWLRNLLLGPNCYWQGIFCANADAIRNNAGVAANHQGVTISDNTVINHHVNSLFIGGSSGLLCERNTVRTLTGTGPGTSQSSIVLGATLIGTIRDNVMPQDFHIARQNSINLAQCTRTNNTITPATVTAEVGRALHRFPVGPYGGFVF